MPSKSNEGLALSENSSISIPLGNLLFLLGAVGVAVFAYTGITEQLSTLENQVAMQQEDIDENSEFVNCWPKDACGGAGLPTDSIQNLKIEQMQIAIDEIEQKLEELKK